MTSIHSNCEGVRRRDFLQIGLGSLLGVGMTDLLRLQSRAGEPGVGRSNPGNETRCILIWLDGGPTHYETFDPKPDAPAEIRGKLGPIATSVDGIRFCETIPKLASIAHKLAVIRSICHRDPNHGGGNHYMMTGCPTPRPVSCGSFVSFHPSLGSVVSYQRGYRGGLPPYITMPSKARSGGPSFLKGQHEPFLIGGDPNKPGYRVRDVVLPRALSEQRAASRLALRSQLDNMKRHYARQVEDPTLNFDSHYEQGIDLISSPDAQAAFDMDREPDSVREKYGRNSFGQRLLLSRRLVEVGVSFVTCYYGGWDDHVDLFDKVPKRLAGVDQGVTALINDLEERGLLDRTLVVMLGEFGRTPIINKDGGRDHWPYAMSVMMAGAGIPGGQVIGATDKKGYYAAENILSPEDFAGSIYTKLNIDPNQILHTDSGRPIPLVNGGAPIKELFA